MSQSQHSGATPRSEDKRPADERVPGDRTEESHTAGAFDIRTLIALLIGIYGLILIVTGIVNSSDADLAKPEGVNINLWTGIAMLVFAALFQAWAMWRPIVVPPREELDENDARADEPTAEPRP